MSETSEPPTDCTVDEAADEAVDVTVVGTDDEGTRWRVDLDFLASSWTCIWGAGCAGIGATPDVARGLGCCSLGAELLDDDEAGMIATLARTLDPARFQYAEAAEADGVLAPRREGRSPATRVVDGACVFLNRPGFEGGAGCALHLAAVDEGDEPLEWKPSVCWQVPLRVDRSGDEATLRRWERVDWLGEPPARADTLEPDNAAEEVDAVAWLCTEAPEARVGKGTMASRHRAELSALLGDGLADEVVARADAHRRGDDRQERDR